MEEHVHCCICYKAIATETIDEPGLPRPVEIHLVDQHRAMMPAPGALAPIVMQRPCCDVCFALLQDQERLAKSRSRLVTAPAGAVPPMMRPGG